MKVDKTIIDLETIWHTNTPTEVWGVLDTLLEVIDDLEADKEYHIENPYNGIDIAKEIETINEQLYYVRVNINTLKIALNGYEEQIKTQFLNPKYFEPIYLN